MLSKLILSSNAADFMALIDELISGVVNSVAGDKAQALSDFFKTNGGLSGLAQKFQNGGANDLFASWVGTGENSLINPDQIDKILGSGPRPCYQARSRYQTSLGLHRHQTSRAGRSSHP
jgi:uncharacterized protein YidB (DUF937 family)